MVYATCSLEPEENEGQIEGFMTRHPQFHLDSSQGVKEEFLDERGYLNVTPQKSGFDGAFAARLRKA